MAFPWGAIISGGASILGSLFGGKKKQEVQQTTSSVDYQALVRNAEAAGFNPLTALRNGGAAGFQTTSTPFMTSDPNIFDRVSQVGMTIGNTLDVFQQNKLATEKRGLEMDLLRSEIGRNNRSNQASPYAIWGAKAPSLQANQAIAPQTQLGKSNPSDWEVGVPTVTSPFKYGGVNPNYVDAEAWETRYGDIAQEVGGFINVLADTAHYMDSSGNTAAINKRINQAADYVDNLTGQAWEYVSPWLGDNAQNTTGGNPLVINVNGAK